MNEIFEKNVGAAFGFCIPVAFGTFNQYFVMRRIFVMSLAQAIIGILMMGFPIMVNFLMETYGFRGMLAIIAALSAHNIFGMMLMHPIEWHYKMIKVPIRETQPCKFSNKTNNEFLNEHLHDRNLIRFYFSNG